MAFCATLEIMLSRKKSRTFNGSNHLQHKFYVLIVCNIIKIENNSLSEYLIPFHDRSNNLWSNQTLLKILIFYGLLPLFWHFDTNKFKFLKKYFFWKKDEVNFCSSRIFKDNKKHLLTFDPKINLLISLMKFVLNKVTESF